jgi:hypothetical protein
VVPITPRQRYLQRWEALKAERSTWLERWRELEEHISSRPARFLASSTNRAEKNTTIINPAPIRAARILAAGMMAGLTSPARKWFRLTVKDTRLAERAGVRAWLHETEEIIRLVFARSNFYNSVFQVYADVGGYGTSAMHIDDDDDDVIRCYTHPIGTYALAASAQQRVDTIYLETSFTVANLVERFGLERCSDDVRTKFQAGELDTRVQVLNVIEPNAEWVPGRIGPEGFRWSSVWMEIGGTDRDGFLLVSGYHYFPVLAPRWDVVGRDVYGSACPGMDALASAKGLQKLEARKFQTLDKLVAPPLAGPASFLTGGVNQLPGGFNPLALDAANQKIEPLYQLHHGIVEQLRQEIDAGKGDVEEALYADVWQLIARSRGDMTAEEVRALQEEKLLLLGPTVDRAEDELLDPAIDITFAILLLRGEIPDPPPELAGASLKVEYISPLVQAQKLTGITGVERLAAFTKGVAEVRGDVLDKVDWDQAIDEYADMLGVTPRLIVDDERVAAIRAERARQQQAEKDGAAMMAAAQGARALAGASLENDNALSRMLAALGAPTGAPA